jgi:hypothetical protein
MMLEKDLPLHSEEEARQSKNVPDKEQTTF